MRFKTLRVEAHSRNVNCVAKATALGARVCQGRLSVYPSW